MLLKITPATKEMSPENAKKMAHNITVVCHLSNLDAKHIVNTACSKGFAHIGGITRHQQKNQLAAVAAECQFIVEWNSPKNKAKV